MKHIDVYLANRLVSERKRGTMARQMRTWCNHSGKAMASEW